MNQITVTVELCAEDRARLDNILERLEKDYTGAAEAIRNAIIHIVDHADEYRNTSKTALAPTEETKPEPVEPAPPAEETPAQPAEQPAAPAVKLADVQQKVVALSAAGKKDSVREVVMSYAERVSAIPEDKLAEVLDKLNALEV